MDSHGTLTAEIIAADASNISSGPYATLFPFTGVAPGVTIGAYRVFSCGGYSTWDIIVAAAYMAAADGADVLNLSIVGGPDYADSFFNIALSRISAAGHIVVQTNGQDGAGGILSNSCAGSEVLSTASIENVVYTTTVIKVDGVSYPYGSGFFANNNFIFPETLDIVINGRLLELINLFFSLL